WGCAGPDEGAGQLRAAGGTGRDPFYSPRALTDPRVEKRKREIQPMPRGKHLRGVGTKEQRQYEHIKASAQRSGRYGRRAKEVAARTVMKQHKSKGHAKGK